MSRRRTTGLLAALVVVSASASAGACRRGDPSATTTATPAEEPAAVAEVEPEPEGPPTMPPHAVVDEAIQPAREAAQRRLLASKADLQPDLLPLPDGPLPGPTLAAEPLPGFFAPMEFLASEAPAVASAATDAGAGPDAGADAATNIEADVEANADTDADTDGAQAAGGGEPNPLGAFEAALDGLAAGERQEPVRIALYGASGTAVDLWTAYLRTYMHARFGDGGPGMVSAAPHNRWYRHHEFEVRSSKAKHWTKHNAFRLESEEDPGYFGVMGVAMSAKSKRAWAEIAPQKGSESARKVRSYDVFYLLQPRGGRFSIKVNGDTVAKVSTKLPRGEKVPRLGVERVEVEPGENVLRLELKGDGVVRFFGVAAETGEPGVVVDTLGVDGARISNWRAWNEALWTEHLRQRAPALYALHFGTNSAVDDDLSIRRYEEDYRMVLGRLRDAAPEASCVILGPGDFPMVAPKEEDAAEVDASKSKAAKKSKSPKKSKPTKKPRSEASKSAAAGIDDDEEGARDVLVPRPLLVEIREVQRRLAGEYGCAYWDMLKFDGGDGAKAAWAEAGLARRDYLHLTRAGYLRWGIAFADALMQRYDWRKSQEGEAVGPTLAHGASGDAETTIQGP